jgi:hypothetical protein
MTRSDKNSVKIINQHGPTGFVAFVAFIGAFVYFLQGTQGFGEVIIAFFKALVWPGFLVFHVLKLLGA